ncbi:MAG: Arc family DNA-binding protein [Cellulomonadaceae bacterium]|jgi:plasmid stability protein|nr:Arc family DNA-binding protein [Cellulomonadaceae bacterium]
MAVVTVRRLPNDVHQALAAVAAVNGRSMEAEAREILTRHVLPDQSFGFGARLKQIGQKARATDNEIDTILNIQPDVVAVPMDLLS